MNTVDVRKSIRTHRKKLSVKQVQTASQKVSKKIIQLPEFLNSKNISCYVSHENEIDPTIIIHRARKLKKSLYVPIFSEKNTLDFYLIDSNTRFFKNKYGIEEPIVTHQNSILANQLDVMLIPLVAFDQNGNRLGRGAGHYDRYLAFTKKISSHLRPTLIGLAYEFQKVKKIIPNEWDVAMDYVVTEKMTYHF